MSCRKLMPWGFLFLLLVTKPAAATTIFADNFNANSPGNLGLNVTPLTWTIASGTVDTLLDFPVSTGGACTTGGGSPSGGVCIDLDGSSSAAGTLMHTLSLASGSYQLSFWLRGNARGGAADTVDFGISGGLLTDTTTLASTAPWTQFVRPFVVSVPGTYTLSFHNLGGDNIGAWLDDVSVDTVGVTAVPEPTTISLVGLGLLGAIRARRKNR
jgi:hypothetical protein